MLDDFKIPKNLRGKVNNELEPGEFIRWVGQPIPRFFTAASIVSFLFSIPWTSFSIFWMWGALGFDFPDLREGFQFEYLFALFGLPFVLIGIGLFSSPLWEWRAARKTIYLVTDKRAISIQGGGWSTVIRSFTPDQLQDLYRKEKANGTGDVIISTRQWKDSDGHQRSTEIGFLGVRNPKEVETLLRHLAQKQV